MKNTCMKMKFISQRNIVLLCYSSNMAAANALYSEVSARQELTVPSYIFLSAKTGKMAK